LLANDRGLRSELGRRARRGYDQYYSKERYINGYFEIIQGLHPRTAM
jgi:hypothetical protein